MGTKKKILITAGGTGSGWRISKTVKQYFPEDAELIITDTNPRELVAAATIADAFFQVQPVNAPCYAENMYSLLQQEKIDAIIPLIPWEQALFAQDREEFAALGVTSASPLMRTEELLNDKQNLFDFCRKNHIPTVPLYRPGKDGFAIDDDAEYVLKKRDGFGAMGLRHILGAELKARIEQIDWNEMVLQPDLRGRGDLPGQIEEVTVEGYCDGKTVSTFVRQRLEAKSGVCTKAAFPKLPELQERVEYFTKLCEFPPAFNIQFAKCDGEWLVMDVNLRIAAGGGLSEAAGFQLSRALIAHLLGYEVPKSWLTPDPTVKHVLRVYQEVVVR
ncbi:MAG: hypothetical protein J6M27_12015 [Lachnospiraceae bacterium]|nr:hypothetical protein [Lachnospiraceae bacterium]